MNGSKEVVELVSSTKTAIGYSGMGYATPNVKMLKIKTDNGSFAPTIENAQSKVYPLARSLLMYTVGEPEGAVKKYIDWILSAAGQKIEAENGYVPLATATASANAN
jgi:phosphate transport system substrate-binding protein